MYAGVEYLAAIHGEWLLVYAGVEYLAAIHGVFDSAQWRECSMLALERQFVQPNRADVFLFFFFDPSDQSGVEMLLQLHELPWVKGLVLTFSHRSGTVFGTPLGQGPVARV